MSNPFEAISADLSEIKKLLLSLKDEKPAPKKAAYLTRVEAAELLHLTLPTLNLYTKSGLIKGYRIGSRVLYLEDEILSSVKEIPTYKYRRG